tara:strand:- start:1879 stop:3018 length:1140 start_codon:yes stop_codon:yes gene_type:complete
LKIAYALAGEGRGHAVRAISLGKGLIERGHEIEFFTCGDALELLQETFGHNSVHDLETPRFVIVKNRVSILRTGLASIRFFIKQRRRKKKFARTLRSLNIEAIISDFEPTFPRVARQLKLPFISFNSQRFSLDAKLDNLLTFRQRLKLLPIKIICRFFAPNPQLSLVSKGFNLKPNKPTAHILGPMLRPEFFPGAWRPTDTHVIAYLRTSVLQHLPAIAEHAKSHGLSLKLYGHYPQNVPDNVEIRPISNDGFIHDLMTANWIVQTAGTQLLGEVGTISIPSMCIPEPGQVEQEINAILAQKAFPNVNILHPKSTSIQALNGVLERCQEESMTSTIQNGRSQAVLIIDTFLNDLESQTAECDQSQELALRTTYERVSAN